MSTIRANKLEHISTTNGGIQLDNAGHVTVDGVQMPTAGALSNRNMLINGAMQVAQRVAYPNTQPGVTLGGYYAVDRYQTGVATAGTWTISQSTEAPAGFSNSIKYDCTTADTSLDATSQLWLAQKIEAQNLQHLNYGTADAQDCTFSFYFKTNKTGVYTVEIFQADANKTVGFEMNVTQTGWQRYEFIVPGDTAGTINNDNDVGLWFFIWMAAGTNYTSGTFTNGTWGAGTTANRLSSNMVNFADSTSNELYVTGYQFELGRKASPYEHKGYGDELQKCLRYFYKAEWAMCNKVSGINYRFVPPGPATVMRSSPAHSYFNPSTGTANQVREHSSGSSYTVNDNNNANSPAQGATTYFGTSSSSTYAVQSTIHYDAEL